MNWIALIVALLQLAVLLARRAERRDIERALTDEIEVLQGKRIRNAADARDDVLSGRVPPSPDDPNRRD